MYGQWERCMGKNDVPVEDRLAYYLLKGMNKAIRDYGMIGDGDRIAVAVSGGKDSFTLLHLLRLRQKSVAEKYQLVAVHVDMRSPEDTPCWGDETHNGLKDYFQAQAQEFSWETIHAQSPEGCFRCAHLRRKAIFLAAKRLDCNKVATGHHTDDAAQTTLLNLIFQGQVETLHPKREFFAGQLVLIRPLIYLQEKEIARFAQTTAFPVIPAGCPHSVTSRRALVKELIRNLEKQYPKVKINLVRAGLRGLSGRERLDVGRDPPYDEPSQTLASGLQDSE
jgi:tRNA 2-thiocytidine biosynthesis protein TtcA